MESVSSPLIIWCTQTYHRRLEITGKVLLSLIFNSVQHKINLYFALENAWHRINDGSVEERNFFLLWKICEFFSDLKQYLLQEKNTCFAIYGAIQLTRGPV